MPNSSPIIAFTGGGSGGHIYPFLPVVERVRKKGYGVLWIGSNRGIERDIAARENIPFQGIPAGKLRRYFSLQNFFDLFRIVTGIFASYRLLLRWRPKLLLSKGGFVSVPPVLAARFLRIPVLTHESDIDPGLANRINIFLGALPLISYQETRDFLSPRVRSRSVLTGNPVRDIMFSGDAEQGRRLARVPPGQPLILVLGGSQGAEQINALIAEILPHLLKRAFVIHQVGRGETRSPEQAGYLSSAYFYEELPHFLAAADLCITRAGAGALWELAATGTPGILVPLGGPGNRGDQLRNAALFQKLGAAVVLKGKAVSGQELQKTVDSLLENPSAISAMAEAIRRLPVREAADKIIKLIQEKVAYR